MVGDLGGKWRGSEKGRNSTARSVGLSRLYSNDSIPVDLSRLHRNQSVPGHVKDGDHNTFTQHQMMHLDTGITLRRQKHIAKKKKKKKKHLAFRIEALFTSLKSWSFFLCEFSPSHLSNPLNRTKQHKYNRSSCPFLVSLIREVQRQGNPRQGNNSLW